MLFRIPTRPRPHTSDWPPVSRWFERAAVAETVTWLALIVGMAVKYLGSGNETGVQVFGLVHGVMALVYAAVTLWAARTLRWGSRTLLLGLLASVPPLGTLWFEAWAERTGRLDCGTARISWQGAGMTNDQKPSVTIPEGDAPTDLVLDDLVVGDGAEAVARPQRDGPLRRAWRGPPASSSMRRGIVATPSTSVSVPVRSSKVGTRAWPG